MKTVVLVSGGIDSTVAYFYAKQQQAMHEALFVESEIVALFVDYRQPYFKQEKTALMKMDIPFKEVYAELCTEKLNNVPTPKRQEIYGRNLLLTFYGALLGDRVWLSALENELWESVPDKHPEFFHAASTLYTLTFKGLRKNTVVETPFANYTKSDVVALGLKLGIQKHHFLKTVSCYDPEGHCGSCVACTKRWIAFTNNDIQEDFKTKPWESEYARKVIRGMHVGDTHYSEKRKQETYKAYRRLGLEEEAE